MMHFIDSSDGDFDCFCCFCFFFERGGGDQLGERGLLLYTPYNDS